MVLARDMEIIDAKLTSADAVIIADTVIGLGRHGLGRVWNVGHERI